MPLKQAPPGSLRHLALALITVISLVGCATQRHTTATRSDVLDRIAQACAEDRTKTETLFLWNEVRWELVDLDRVAGRVEVFQQSLIDTGPFRSHCYLTVEDTKNPDGSTITIKAYACFPGAHVLSINHALDRKNGNAEAACLRRLDQALMSAGSVTPGTTGP